MTATAEYKVDWAMPPPAPAPVRAGPGRTGTSPTSGPVMGTYDVVVTAVWTVDWRMGEASGRLTTTTEGVIDGFRVTQLQAVRNS